MPRPSSLQQILDQDPSLGLGEVRRRLRCSQGRAQEIWQALLSGTDTVLENFPDELAILLGDPEPRLLQRLLPQRLRLQRLLRRGRRLEALGLLQEQGLEAFEARRFLAALHLQSPHWQLLQQLYELAPPDFWERRPQPLPPLDLEFYVQPPAEFCPQLLLQWLTQGQVRAACLWLRQVSRAPASDCQALVDRLEELVFDHHPNPWQEVYGHWPSLIDALAGRPDSRWLTQLQPRKQELLQLLQAGSSLRTVQWLCRQLACQPPQARQFLRRLRPESWEQLQEPLSPFAAAPAKVPMVVIPEPPPKVVISEPLPRVVIPEPPPQVVVLETPPPPAPKPEPKSTLPNFLAEAPPPLPELPPPSPAAPPLDLQDPLQVLDQLIQLGEALRAGEPERALANFDQLEQAGFNRAWVLDRFPMALPWLPQDPWSEHLQDLAQMAQRLKDWTHQPAQMTISLFDTRLEQLKERLGQGTWDKLRQAFPELLQAAKQRDMRAIMRVLSRLRLGASDVKAVVNLLKSQAS